MSNEVQAELAGLQNALLKTDSVEQFLHELAVLAARTVGEGEGMSCGMALRQRGRPRAAAACSDPLASEADECSTRRATGRACTRCGTRARCASTTRRPRPLAALLPAGGALGIRSCSRCR